VEEIYNYLDIKVANIGIIFTDDIQKPKSEEHMGEHSNLPNATYDVGKPENEGHMGEHSNLPNATGNLTNETLNRMFDIILSEYLEKSNKQTGTINVTRRGTVNHTVNGEGFVTRSATKYYGETKRSTK